MMTTLVLTISWVVFSIASSTQVDAVCHSPNATGATFIASAGTLGSDLDLEGKNWSYQGAESCSWTIECPNATSNVSYTLEGSTYNSKDPLTVSPLVGDGNSNRTFYGVFGGVHVLSNSPRVLVHFMTDASNQTTDYGWNLQWTCTDSRQMCNSPNASESASGSGTTVVKVNQGTLLSDGDGTSSSHSYSLGQNCLFNVQCPLPTAKYIALTSAVNLDFRHELSVFDGRTGALLQHLRNTPDGGADAEVLILDTNNIVISFSTISSTTRAGGPGWTVDFLCSADRCSGNDPVSGSILSGSASVATAPRISLGSTTSSFALGELCVWEIDCPPGSKYLYVDYTTNFGSSGLLNMKLPGASSSFLSVSSSTPFTSFSTPLGSGERSTTVHTTFQSSASTSPPAGGGGFDLAARCAATQCSSPNASQTAAPYTAMEGTFVSDPDGAGTQYRYTQMERCVWDVQCPLGHHFAVTSFLDWEPGVPAVSILTNGSGVANFTFAATWYKSHTSRMDHPQRAVFRNSTRASIHFSGSRTQVSGIHVSGSRYGFSLTYACIKDPCLNSEALDVNVSRSTLELGGQDWALGSLCQWNVSCPPTGGSNSSAATPKFFIPLTYSYPEQGGIPYLTTRVYENVSLEGSANSNITLGTGDVLSIVYQVPLAAQQASPPADTFYYSCLVGSAVNATYHSFKSYSNFGQCYSPTASITNPDTPDLIVVGPTDVPETASSSSAPITAESDLGSADSVQGGSTDGSGVGRSGSESSASSFGGVQGGSSQSGSSTPSSWTGAGLKTDPDGYQSSFAFERSYCKWVARCQNSSEILWLMPYGNYQLGSYWTRSESTKKGPLYLNERAFRLLSEDLKSPSAILSDRMQNSDSSMITSKSFAFYNGESAALDIYAEALAAGFSVDARCVRDVCNDPNGTTFSPTLLEPTSNINSSPVKGAICSYRLKCPSDKLAHIVWESEYVGVVTFTSATTGREIGPDIPKYSASFHSSSQDFVREIRLPEHDVWMRVEGDREVTNPLYRWGWRVELTCVDPQSYPLSQLPEFGDANQCKLTNEGSNVGTSMPTHYSLDQPAQTFRFGPFWRPTTKRGCNISFDCGGVEGAHTMILSVLGVPQSYDTSQSKGEARLMWETYPYPRMVSNLTNSKEVAREWRSNDMWAAMISAENGNTAVFEMAERWWKQSPLTVYCISDPKERPLDRAKRSLTKFTNPRTWCRRSPRSGCYYSPRYTDQDLHDEFGLMGEYRRNRDEWTVLQCPYYYSQYRVSVVEVLGNVDKDSLGDYMTIYNGETGDRIEFNNVKNATVSGFGFTAKSLLVHFRSSAYGGDGILNNGYMLKLRCGAFSLGQFVTVYTNNGADGVQLLPVLLVVALVHLW